MKKDEHGTIIGTTKKAPYGYGQCPVCKHKNVHLTEDGVLAMHGDLKAGTWCAGDGQYPVWTPAMAVRDEESMIAERAEADRVARARGATGRAHRATDFPLWLCSFLDKDKRVVDHVTYRAVSRDDARRIAVERYLENGDKALYAGFVVSEEKHGGY